MKTVLFFLTIIILLLSCSDSSKGTPVKLPQAQVDTKQLDKAVQFANGLFSNWNDGIYNTIPNDVATSKFADNLTPELQRNFFEETVLPTYGRLQYLVYVETYTLRDQNIYRFKGIFEKGGEPEVRVVMNKENRVAGLWLKPWVDEIQ